MSDEMTEQIAEIMANFDFNKCAAVMRRLNWQWSSIERVPDDCDLSEHAAKYLIEVANREGECETMSGGFRARKIIQDGKPRLILSFELETWDAGL